MTCNVRVDKAWHVILKLKQANDLSVSAESEELTDLCFITVCTYVFVGNVDLPSKQPVKKSRDNARHHFDTELDLAFVHTALVPDRLPQCYYVPDPGSIR